MTPISNQTILITGSTDGLGKQVALALAKQGASVILHGRNELKGEKTLNEIISLSGNNNVRYFNADLASLSEVRELAESVKHYYPRLDMLINNAGIYLTDDVRKISREGFELNWAVNYLAPFLLTHLLLPLLKQTEITKIINVSSGAQFEFDFNNIMLEHDYTSRRAYAQSKHALIMFTFTLASQLKDSRIRVNALHPEKLMNTKMVLDAFGSSETTIEMGVDNVLYVATASENDNITGAYFDKKQITPARYQQAYDIIALDKLYRMSKEWVKI